MRPFESMIHFLNQAIEMDVGAMLRELIGSEEHQMGETPGMGESQSLTLAVLTADTRKALWSSECSCRPGSPGR
jgi:hypothetical protein